MAWGYALTMSTVEEYSLREYLHLLSKRVKDPPCNEVYEAFLSKVWSFFNLRVRAEEFFRENRHVAISHHGALPVDWFMVKDALGVNNEPPEQAITLISKRNYNDVNSLIGNLRKVLNRVRQKVAIGRVQQVDSHCLRWLTRQPGRTAAEKGGSRQEILGIVRVENYNTLENRVLKDFMSRCIGLATMYLRRYDVPQFHEHVNVRSVRRFKNLCIGGLAVPEFESVGELREFPQPNYVLQQDRLYSKIWCAYGDVMRQEDVAETLWKKRDEVDYLYNKCKECIPVHCSPKAKFATPLWVNEIDGRRPIIEVPVWKNELFADVVESPVPPRSECVTVDFTCPWDARDELVYPKKHRNARPFIQNPHRPSLEPGERVSLQDIIRKRDFVRLADYLRQLHGLLRGSRWIVLVPDDWQPEWLEAVIRARPPALARDRMFLLWRSVAAALGAMERYDFPNRGSLVVADGYQLAEYNAVEIRFMRERKTGRILPQRSSVSLHSDDCKDCTDVRFYLNRSYRDQSAVYKLGDRQTLHLGIGLLRPTNFIYSHEGMVYSVRDEILRAGVQRYLREESKGLISYFDELDGLYLVIQTKGEEVEFKPLVEPDEFFPGGTLYKGSKQKGGALPAGATKLSLYLLQGEQRDNVLLKEMVENLEYTTSQTADIFFEASITPGQGLASVMFSADFLEKPLPLDLTKLTSSEYTKSRIEREMKRHFPPVMPYVEASEDIWNSVRYEVMNYIHRGGILADTGLFYKPQPYFGKIDPMNNKGTRHYGHDRFFDERTMSPIDLLKRENVFGNAPGHEFPTDDVDWNVLFRRLASDFRSGHDVVRLIAWTYQSENEEFEPIRNFFYKSYVVRGEPLKAEAYSFCANCFQGDDKRIADILETALSRIASSKERENEYRLVYNILQFHPEAISKIHSELCEAAFKRTYYNYNKYPFLNRWGGFTGTQAVKMAGYYLKTMLFLLHRRRYDSDFILRSENWQPSGFLAESLPTRTQTQTGHEALRVSFLKYVRGHGTIDGIPMGD